MKKSLFALISIIISSIIFYYIGKNNGSDITQVNEVAIKDTIYKIDTVPYPIHHYHVKVDTLPNDTIYPIVDTASILEDYFNRYAYHREWNDTNVTIKLNDIVSMNKIINGELTYKINRPQQIITETHINYNKYLCIGLSAGKSDFMMNVSYVSNKYGVGVSYEPFKRQVLLSGSVNILKLK